MIGELRLLWREAPPKLKQTFYVIRPAMLGAFLAMWISVSYLLSGHNRWWPVGLALASVSCSLVSYWRLRPMLRRLLGPESSDQRQ